jgi:cytochrome c oxidase subunit II
MNFRATSSKGETARSLRSVLLSLAAVLLLLSTHSGLKAADAAKGQILFKANCASCHNTQLEKKLTGPGLYKVSERIPGGDWIYNWVHNSGKMIAEGDVYANKIYGEYKSAMTAFPNIKNEEIDDILAWIEAYKPAIPTKVDDNSVNLSDDKGLSSLWNWARLLIFVIVVLMVNIALQVARLRGVEFFGGINLDKFNARMMLGFFVVGIIAAFWSLARFQPYFLQQNSASEHGVEIDQLFWITMSVVFFVFVVTNAVLFFFAYKYGKDGGRKAKYYPENHKLELIWTVVPAVVLAVLIIFGIKTWTSIMSPPDASKEIVKIEVSGQQWGWTLRYPGEDKTFGDISVRRIGGDNILGVDFSQEVSRDDFMNDSLVMPVGATVDLKIRSRDVLHSVYLPHFRVKMDAVPGMDTRFHFVPNQTTEQYRETLKNHVYWGQVDTIVNNAYAVGDKLPDGSLAKAAVTITDTVFNYDNFDFELACTEICGRGHFSMRRVVVVMTPEKYAAWKAAAGKNTLISSMKYDPSKEFPTMADGSKSIGDATTSIIK